MILNNKINKFHQTTYKENMGFRETLITYLVWYIFICFKNQRINSLKIPKTTDRNRRMKKNIRGYTTNKI